MVHRSYICTNCRTTKRAKPSYGLNTPLRCSGCGGELFELSNAHCVPKKGDDRAWKKLAQDVAKWRLANQRINYRHSLDKLEKLEREKEVVQAQPPSSGKDSTLESIEKQMKFVKKKYLAPE